MLILCDNKKCVWNEVAWFIEEISRNECKRGGLIRISKEGYCENIELKEPDAEVKDVKNLDNR